MNRLAEGDFVMLVYPPCIEFILIFLGCLRAGIVAVPVYPPSTYVDYPILHFRSFWYQEERSAVLRDSTELPSQGCSL